MRRTWRRMMRRLMRRAVVNLRLRQFTAEKLNQKEWYNTREVVVYGHRQSQKSKDTKEDKHSDVQLDLLSISRLFFSRFSILKE